MEKLAMSLYIFKLSIFLVSIYHCIYWCNGCMEEERAALLQIKDSINYPSGSSLDQYWVGNDCCNWSGIECNHFSSRVTSIDLKYTRDSGLEIWYPNATLFAQFKELSKLYLDDNKIGGWVMPQAFSEMQCLQNLSLGGNNLNEKINSLWGLCELKNLRTLDLRSNNLDGRTLPPCLCELKNLRTLDLGSNNLDGRTLPPCVLSNLSMLEHLYLSGNNLGSSPDALTAAGGLASVLLRLTHPYSLVLLLALFLFFILQFWRETSTDRKSPPLPPGPKPWPIIGNLLELFWCKPAFRWILGLMKEMNTEIACIKLGNVHVIPVTCPEIAREFLKKQDAVFASRPITMGSEYVSRGFLSVILAPLGYQWKKMRRIMASEMLSATRLRWLLEKRVEEADNLVRYLYSQCQSSGDGDDHDGGAVVNVRVAVRQYSGNAIRKMMFNQRYLGAGRNDGGPGVEEEEHIEALFTTLSLLYVFCVSDYMPSLRWFDLDGHEKMMKKAIGVVNKYHEPIIDERIKRWRSSGKGMKEPEDLLDILVSVQDADGKPLLTPEEIKAQVTELFIASIDNPSNAVEWAMAEMLNQPEILHKAVEELDRVVGKERLVQESDFPSLNYIKACAREALRLHPMAAFNLPHVSTADSTVCGYFIPEGSHVILSRIGLGRNPKVWEEPLHFKPERHLNCREVQLSEPDLRFITFSTGRRGCMGALLGSAMTVMLLARVLQGFAWSLPEGESRIELSESTHDLFLAEPLRAHAVPRLPSYVYPPR